MSDPSGQPAPVPAPDALPPRPPASFARSTSQFWAARRLGVPTPTLALCAVAGLAGGTLVVGHEPGLGVAVVGLLVWAAALPALLRRRAADDLLTATLAVALVAVVALRDAEWVVALCITAAVVAGTVAATSARSAPAVLLSAVSWAAGAVRTLPWLAGAAGGLAGPRRGQVLVALRSVVVTAALLVVFGLLFASADQVFASYLPSVELDLLPAQVVVGLLTALLAASLAHLALAPPGWSGLRVPPGTSANRGEWLLPVLALDAMVLAFIGVQVGALAGGHRHVLESAGLSYAEYARGGFGQLVAVTALTLLVVGVAARRAPRGTDSDRLLVRIALGVLCVATLGVVASALMRMNLYVEAFGLTRLRLFVVVVEVVLGVVLLLVLAAGVRWRGGWLPRAVVQVAAAAVLGLAVANPDALIVRHNVAAELDAPLDATYLGNLSADAVPAMADTPEPLRSCLLSRVGVDPVRGALDWNLGRDLAARTMPDERPECEDQAVWYPWMR